MVEAARFAADNHDVVTTHEPRSGARRASPAAYRRYGYDNSERDSIPSVSSLGVEEKEKLSRVTLSYDSTWYFV